MSAPLTTRDALAVALCEVRDDREHAGFATPAGESCRYCDDLADRLAAALSAQSERAEVER